MSSVLDLLKFLGPWVVIGWLFVHAPTSRTGWVVLLLLSFVGVVWDVSVVLDTLA